MSAVCSIPGNHRHTRITQEELKHQLDSLNKLIKGENISAGCKKLFHTSGQDRKDLEFTMQKYSVPISPCHLPLTLVLFPKSINFIIFLKKMKSFAKLTEMSKYKYEKGDEKRDWETGRMTIMRI